mgnify:CR=1 FL=1
MSFPEHFISVFARNCNVRRMDSPEARTFIERHHRYGWSKCRYCYGLFVEKEGRDGQFHKDDLVAVSCFSNARKWEKDGTSIKSYEWVRYASIEGVRVSGGMGKMLNAFIEDIRPDDVMSYAPLSEGGEGEVYLKLGFTLEEIKEFGNGKSAKFRLKLTDYR